jgi:hypothetical protein
VVSPVHERDLASAAAEDDSLVLLEPAPRFSVWVTMRRFLDGGLGNDPAGVAVDQRRPRGVAEEPLVVVQHA